MKKAERYPIRVNLFLDAKMKDALDKVARTLQRAKGSKGERITINTVMRAALVHFLDKFDVNEAGATFSEEDLHRIVTHRIITNAHKEMLT